MNTEKFKEVLNTVICGDTLSVLKTFPDECLNTVITSPPYWSLRDYSTEPQIWDGDGDCQHRWDIKERWLHRGSTKLKMYDTHGIINNQKIQDNFCSICGAWQGSLGLEPTFELYLKHLCDIFDEVKRVLRKDGSCWVNLGDTYASGNSERFDKQKYGGKEGIHCGRGRISNYPQKSLCLIPERFAIEMVSRGWVLRNKIIWHKRNCMPSSVKDRFTVDFEDIFFFVKNKKYWFEQILEPNCNVSIKRAEYEQGRNALGKNPSSIGYKSDSYGMPARFVKLNPEGHNKRCVWDINTKSFHGAHFAVFPEALVEPMIKAGCPVDGIVLDPFCGSGTTCLVAKKLGRKYIGIDLKPEYCEMAKNRIGAILL